jgi:hypothetical protein
MPSLIDKISWRLTPGYYVAKLSELAERSPALHPRIADAVRAMIPDRPLAAGRGARVDVDVDASARDLTESGMCSFGQVLGEPDIRALLGLSDELLAHDPWDESSGRFPWRQAPSNCHTAQFDRGDLLRSELVMDLANDPCILSVAKRFLGATPTLSNVTMWWSLAGRSAPKEAQLFHRDRDDLRFCKLFFYLTDVDMESGPHVYVRGSAQDERLREHRRLSDDEVTATFGADRVTHVCGPAGSAFLVNTYGIHKGLLPKSRDRLLLQLQYSLLPIGRERYERTPKIRDEGRYDPYVNRLFLEGGGYLSVPRGHGERSASR